MALLYSFGQGLRQVSTRCRLRGLSPRGRLAKFHSRALLFSKALPPRRKIHEEDIEEAFLKGSGPGGQKINKTSSAVQLIHKPTGIVVKAQDTRSRSQNRKLARQRLADMIDAREKGNESRIAIKVASARKKKSSAMKKSRRKYRALDAEKLSAPNEPLEGPAAEDLGTDTRRRGG